MRTFAPISLFFHVRDKFQPRFIKHDRGVSLGATYVYVLLFEKCGEKDHCWLSQTTMAVLSKSSVRTVQNYLGELVKADYIEIRKDERGHNVYYLLLSPRLVALLGKLNIPVHESPAERAANAVIEGHENFSPNIRNHGDQNTPLSPLQKPAAPGYYPPSSRRNRIGFPSTLQRVQRRGDSFLSAQSRLSNSHDDFERLWAAWPDTAAWDMPRNKQHARRVFCRMKRAGLLPPLEKLLGIVEHYKLTDSRWLNGYPPELSNFLYSRQFEKAPLVRPKKTFFGKFFGKPELAEPVLTPEEQRQAERLRQQMEALRKRYAKPRFTSSASTPPSSEMETLITLWPEPERQRMPIQGFLQYLAQSGKKLDLGRLLPEAREYLASTSSPMSLIGWLRGNAACVL